MTQTLTQKSMLARLLANENIDVVQGNYPTAFFDVEKRVLGLPFFNNDISKDLYDLLVGHEVGHALFTPADGWHDSETEVPNAPRALINIIEDIRIEKLILRKYPGLFAGFKRGYKELLDRNFFGIDGENVNEMNMLDRLNLFSKSRGLIDVEFADEEKALIDQAMNVETWEDVLKACSDIADFMGLEKPAEEETEMVEVEVSVPVQTDGSDENEGDDQEGSSISSNEQSEEAEEEESDSSESGDEPSDEEGEESNDEASDGDEESNEEPTEGSASNADAEEEEPEKDAPSSVGGNDAGRSTQEKTIISKTDEAFRENEKALVDNVTAGGNSIFVKGMSRDMFNQVKVPFKKIDEHRKACGSYDRVQFPQDKYDAWMKDAKGQVNLLVKEFEMRKAAYRTQRARTSNKGSLDVTKLHKYKYDDQLFKQVTHLADAKSHGMVMVVDFSGSMHRQIESVLRQTMIMGMFCKRVGIPFEVYGFTNAAGEQYREAIEVDKKENMHTKVLTGDSMLTEILTSSMNKQTFESQLRYMFNVWRHMYYGQNGYDNMRGTPLYEALMATHYVLEDFQKKNPVQKLNVLILTDGHGDRVHIQNGIDVMDMEGSDRYYFDPTYGKDNYLDFRGKQMKVDLRGRDYGNTDDSLQVNLLKSLREEFGATVSHFYVADSAREYKYVISRATGSQWDEAQKIVNESRKKGAFVIDNDQGYDRRFILEAKGDVLKRRDSDTDSIEVDSEMTAAQIATAFKKSSNGRSKQRFFSQKFAELIA